MTPEDFVKKYYPFAKKVEEDTGIPALAIMAQAALEANWGRAAIGNNIFGIKFRKGDWKHQRVLTTEYDSNRNAYNGKDVKSVTYDSQTNKYKFKVWQYFADYQTPYDGFMAHAGLLLSNRYKHALRWSYSPLRYLIAIWKAGYATDPVYGKKMAQMIDSVKRRL